MKIRQFTEDQIIKLLQDGKKGERSVEDLCRDFGCSTASYYAWKKKYGDTNADEAKRLRRLEKENARLLRIVGQQRLEIDAMKDVIGKSGNAHSETRRGQAAGRGAHQARTGLCSGGPGQILLALSGKAASGQRTPTADP
ncbi:transposase [Deinococcus radiopugnans]|uniref:transposase n=1 Tax=Deinococcus radiopugnans TaxID=57497 RepID=UPI00360EF57D